MSVLYLTSSGVTFHKPSRRVKEELMELAADDKLGHHRELLAVLLLLSLVRWLNVPFPPSDTFLAAGMV
jgi:hypothetical protein